MRAFLGSFAAAVVAVLLLSPAPAAAAAPANGLSGIVTRDSRSGIASVCVKAYDATSNAVAASTVTSVDGAWTIASLPGPSYKVGFEDCGSQGYAALFYGDAQTLPEATAVPRGSTVDLVLTRPLMWRWKDAVTKTATTPADALFMGNSITEGYSAGARDKWWVDILRRSLQGSTPGGIGYVPIVHSEFTAPPFAELWKRSGGAFFSWGLGRRSYLFDSGGDSATLTFSGDRVKLNYTGGPIFGKMRIAVDGKAPKVVDTSGALYDANRWWDSGALKAGNHTLTISTPPASAAFVLLQGAMVFKGDATRGARVWDGSHGGYEATPFATDDSHWSDALATVDPDVVVMEFGINDAGTGTPETFEAHLNSVLDLLFARTAKDPDVLLLAMWADGRDPAVWQQFVDVQHRVAAQRRLSVVDALPAGSTTPLSTLTTDGIHPNVAGNAFLADRVGEALRS